MATKTDTIHARVEPELKSTAEAVFRELGLTTTDAIRLFLRQVALRHGLPFEVRIPNETTRKTFERTDAGEDLYAADSDEDLFDQLGI